MEDLFEMKFLFFTGIYQKPRKSDILDKYCINWFVFDEFKTIISENNVILSSIDDIKRCRNAFAVIKHNAKVVLGESKPDENNTYLYYGVPVKVMFFMGKAVAFTSDSTNIFLDQYLQHISSIDEFKVKIINETIKQIEHEKNELQICIDKGNSMIIELKKLIKKINTN